jgi:hypothetical protein
VEQSFNEMSHFDFIPIITVMNLRLEDTGGDQHPFWEVGYIIIEQTFLNYNRWIEEIEKE